MPSTTFARITQQLPQQQLHWLVTGAAGFIGSHLVHRLLSLGQLVVGMDNFATGHRANLQEVERLVGPAVWNAQFQFIEGSIEDSVLCKKACQRVSIVLHQAALGSVPRSIDAPVQSTAANVGGFVQLVDAARHAGIKRIVYASSSSVYGDEPQLPKVEERIGKSLSPYAATKRADEIFAEAFASVYGIDFVGLRYFNVFGPRQDPAGAYAAVVPRWIQTVLNNEECIINGDGETSRDFCYVENVVQANILAALTDNADAVNTNYNIAVGEQTTLNELFAQIVNYYREYSGRDYQSQPTYKNFRAGDVRHSLADISKAKSLLDYAPTHTISDGLRETVQWFINKTGTL